MILTIKNLKNHCYRTENSLSFWTQSLKFDQISYTKITSQPDILLVIACQTINSECHFFPFFPVQLTLRLGGVFSIQHSFDNDHTDRGVPRNKLMLAFFDLMPSSMKDECMRDEKGTGSQYFLSFFLIFLRFLRLQITVGRSLYD